MVVFNHLLYNPMSNNRENEQLGQDQTWHRVSIQERDLHVGMVYKAANFYGMCDLCGGDVASFQIRRTSKDTRNKYTHDICQECASKASLHYGTHINHMRTGLVARCKP